MTRRGPREGGEPGELPWHMNCAWPKPGLCRVFDLAHPLEHGIPHAPAHPPYAFTLTKLHGDTVFPGGVSAAADMLAMAGHMGTHIDALGHISRNGLIHGGIDVTSAQSHCEGLKVGTVEELQPIFAPGHLVDAALLRGQYLVPGDAVGRSDFERWFQGRSQPGPGSVVLVRTGWGKRWPEARTYLNHPEGVPGVDMGGARWLSEHGVQATGSDTIAYEQTPSPDLAVHAHLLVDSGIPIIEALNLEALAAAGTWEFFFVAIPLRIRGGTGSPLRPLAVVNDIPAATPDSGGENR